MPMMLLAAVVLVISLLAAASGPALHPDRRDAPVEGTPEDLPARGHRCSETTRWRAPSAS